MKKSIILALSAILVVSSATSCVKEFLDIKPRGSDVATKIEHYQGLLSSQNFMSYTSPTYFHMGEELCGDAKTLERIQSSEKDKGLFAFKFDRDPFQSEDACYEWEIPYARIYTCNFIIANVMNAETGTDAQKKEILAEARMHRAFYHYFASIMFSKHYDAATAATDLAVPIVTKAETEPTVKYERATVKTLFDWVINEMKESLSDLPDAWQNNSRCTKAAGNMMLGKVYWYMGDYQNALTHLRQAVTLTKNLKGSPVTFNSYRNNHSAWYNASKKYYTSYTTNGYNPESLLLKYIVSTTMVSATSAAFHYVKTEYVQMYGEGDLRAYLLAPSTTDATMMRPVARTDHNFCGDLPDLYMMLAECEARVGSESDARSLMLEYRKARFDTDEHAAIPASVSSKEDLIKFIVNERTLEYIARGVSVIDMKRLWNDPLFASKKANFTHPIKGGDTYSVTSEDQLTWKIPIKVFKFHPEWQNN